MASPPPWVASEPSPVLVPMAFWLPSGEGPLLPRVRAALKEWIRSSGSDGDVLRWAITAVDSRRGVQLEAVVVTLTPAPAASASATTL